MHRGRSRKRVEASGVTIQSNLHTATCAKFPPPIPENHQNKNLFPSRSKGLTNTATTITASSANGKSKLTNTFVKTDESSSNRENSDHLDGVDAGLVTPNKEDFTNGDKHGGLVTPELSISVKNVVYSDTVNSKAVCKNRDITAEEPQRCKRTDGKSWRCSKEAIPQKKYCGSHINRGSKRCRSSSEAATAATLVTLKNDHTNLNTDLPILHAKCPPTVMDVDSSTSGSK
ncbi:hypothetical protein POM88_032475 [Heracleum sosnowskyi]|uniref:Growth-regulating factor n=1 Tax=Heracleum sosnowskyi TaxID=360622 RepID=A0AAD8HZC7_9APIA|nr:hypothetical protein POM88_032475 [Heracleum sosnowskyi]